MSLRNYSTRRARLERRLLVLRERPELVEGRAVVVERGLDDYREGRRLLGVVHRLQLLVGVLALRGQLLRDLLRLALLLRDCADGCVLRFDALPDLRDGCRVGSWPGKLRRGSCVYPRTSFRSTRRTSTWARFSLAVLSRSNSASNGVTQRSNMTPHRHATVSR